MTSVKWGLLADRVDSKSPKNSLGERRCGPKLTNRYPEACRFGGTARSDRGLPDVHP